MSNPFNDIFQILYEDTQSTPWRPEEEAVQRVSQKIYNFLKANKMTDGLEVDELLENLKVKKNNE